MHKNLTQDFWFSFITKLYLLPSLLQYTYYKQCICANFRCLKLWVHLEILCIKLFLIMVRMYLEQHARFLKQKQLHTSKKCWCICLLSKPFLQHILYLTNLDFELAFSTLTVSSTGIKSPRSRLCCLCFLMLWIMFASGIWPPTNIKNRTLLIMTLNSAQ